MPYRYKKKRYKIKPLPVIIVLLILVLVGFLIFKLINQSGNSNNTKITVSSSSDVSSDDSSIPSSTVVSDSSSTPSSAPASSKPANSNKASSKAPSSSKVSSKTANSSTARPAGSKSDWNLILLNPAQENKIDTDLDIEMTKFDTQWVDSRAAQAYKDMRAAAAKKNITLYLRSGYRSMATQKRNYDNEVARYVGLGNSQEEAIRLTSQYYTVPGHSEHHTGLAFDTITPEYHNTVHILDERFAKTDAYKWLVANCADYGFILRYPKDKKDALGGINFEPWHYRYVGVEHAKYMTKNNLCLEEYLKLFEE